jgi:hypothetical protein
VGFEQPIKIWRSTKSGANMREIDNYLKLLGWKSAINRTSGTAPFNTNNEWDIKNRKCEVQSKLLDKNTKKKSERKREKQKKATVNCNQKRSARR